MSSHFYCVLLGAGASADANVPTSQKLLKDFLASCNTSEKSKIEEVIENEDGATTNIEQIGLLIRHKEPKLYIAIRSFMINRLRNHDDSGYTRELFHLDLDGTLGVVIDSVPLWKAMTPIDYNHITTTRVFSLNYDTCVEDSIGLSDPYLGLFYWDPDDHVYVYRSSSIYDHRSGNFIDPAHILEKDPKVAIPRKGIIKLHGSLNWIWQGKGRDRKLIVGKSKNNQNDIELIFAEPEKLRLIQPYNDIFYAFSLAISECKALIVIGYSWSDSYINRLIEHECERGMKVVNVSISSSNVRPSYVKLPPDTVFINASAKQALERSTVEYAIGQEASKKIDGGLVSVVRETLHKQLWIKTAK